MSKFKTGDIAFSLFDGFQELRETIDECIFHGVYSYWPDGKYNTTDKYPTLLTVEEAAKLGYFPEKKKVMKRDVIWVNVYKDGEVWAHETKERADYIARGSIDNRIRCLRFVSDEYES